MNNAAKANTVQTKAGDTLSAICWRYYGSSRGKVEAVLAANPKLATEPAILSAGIYIVLPAAPSTAAKTLPTINLWD